MTAVGPSSVLAVGTGGACERRLIGVRIVQEERAMRRAFPGYQGVMPGRS
jgi:hypothetical protein